MADLRMELLEASRINRNLFMCRFLWRYSSARVASEKLRLHSQQKNLFSLIPSDERRNEPFVLTGADVWPGSGM
jgi:hypothetical protein